MGRTRERTRSGQNASVPAMGQFDYDEELRVAFAEYATDVQIHAALRHAHEQLTAAADGHHLVTLQAIHALAWRGLSTRQIAGIVDISKSAVSRHLATDVPGVTVRQPDEVASIVRKAWKGLTRPAALALVEEWAAGRVDRRKLNEVTRATDASDEAGADWLYRLSVYRFRGDGATRDSFASALRQSAWMAAAIDRAGAAESCTLWALCRYLERVHNRVDYDRIVRAINELAEADRCRIQFVDPPSDSTEL